MILLILPKGITGFTDNMEEMVDGQKFKKVCYEVLREACNSVPNFYWVNDFNNWIFESNGIKEM